ncbi:MAG: UDP-N-acetylmuramate:L-alanyl-gamma-D-glutamyl-meso-diaminopimelate ligase [endosymbiont of Galathealinum brachiosum]|uniref:UDP-N-acetylmuramate--L-alanyl-gamma-D-glutamyl-meso-2,6-diaminoheptandioate ligase n=1 Tax=endosymbiont of Galathealinum brachiosum TaxID=2200906 RepID=A0A370D9Q7_9GAMM|nr:MAG: UDP-N-acetylmuramate:L-alanyl-gamma-D-glutamyl-meso-diaminopimelate ligase [endosymbiont of Galathealinum brachiosum]
MHIHILGICGTFMGGVAVLARQAGHKVTGSDANVYPPMSTQLEAQGIELMQGFKVEHLTEQDQVVVGNVMSRGNEAIEHVLNENMSYTSGPQWLAENVLKDKWVLAVAGTHGKTTTSSILAWILEYAGLQPGFLIGGVPANFGISARLGEGPFFVVEADEYDTAFFDKRSKFVHYHPRTAILNNLEFDHADIFENLDAIKKQFHHLVRTVPGDGLIVHNDDEENIQDVLQKGCWSERAGFAGKKESLWMIDNVSSDGRCFDVLYKQKKLGTVKGNLLGPHNRMNALAAIIAAQHVGVPVEQSIDALKEFKGIKRRMEVAGEVNDKTVYDDFAHHPTAITETLKGLRDAVGSAKIWAVLEPRSNTMRMGVHKKQLAPSLDLADEVILFQPADVDWDMQSVVDEVSGSAKLMRSIDDVVDLLAEQTQPGDHILVMSNGAFGGIHHKILEKL